VRIVAAAAADSFELRGLDLDGPLGLRLRGHRAPILFTLCRFPYLPSLAEVSQSVSDTT
jgi:hypothetical protein